MKTPHDHHDPDLSEFRSLLLDEPDLAAARTRVRSQLEQAYDDAPYSSRVRRLSPTHVKRLVYGSVAAAASIALVGTVIALNGDEKVNINQVDQPTPSTTIPTQAPTTSPTESSQDQQPDSTAPTATSSPTQPAATQTKSSVSPMPVFASKYVIGKEYPVIASPEQGKENHWTMQADKPVSVDLVAQGGLPKNAHTAYILVELVKATQDGLFTVSSGGEKSVSTITLYDPETGKRNSDAWVVEVPFDNRPATLTSTIDATYKMSLIGYEQDKKVSEVDLTRVTTGMFRVFAADNSAACIVEANGTVSCESTNHPKLPEDMKGLRLPEDSYCEQNWLTLELPAGKDPRPWCPGDLFVGTDVRFEVSSPGSFTAPGGTKCTFKDGAVSCQRPSTGQAFSSGPKGWSLTTGDGKTITLP